MKKLIRGLGEFKNSYFSDHQDLFIELTQGQKPRVLFITCSDSRIVPNLITQAEVGELFIIRNAGNIIHPFGAANGGEGATVEYAIHSLGIEQIVVCGHSHCGAIKGLLKLNELHEEMPLMYNWLKHTEATQRLIKENYGHLQGEELLESLWFKRLAQQGIDHADGVARRKQKALADYLDTKTAQIDQIINIQI